MPMRISPGAVPVNEEPESVGREMEGAMVKGGAGSCHLDHEHIRNKACFPCLTLFGKNIKEDRTLCLGTLMTSTAKEDRASCLGTTR
jgi:hypothetical protein